MVAFGFTEGKGSLPGARRELDAIREDFVMVDRSGKECRSQLFLKEASQFQVVHLAIHGQADNEDLLKSRLIFSEGDTLFSYQLYPLRLNSPLVVLSSCEGAIGKVHNGEGIFSMARSFILSGASSLVVTLWRTPDNSSAGIFEEFYKSLSSGKNSSESIQLAKLNYLERADNINAHPFFWAGIKPVATFKHEKDWKAIYAWLIILLFGFCFLIFRRKNLMPI